jgi:hypothetical protein
MTYGVPKDLLENIRANQTHELEIIVPDYAAMMAEKGVSFHEQEGSEPPYRHIGHPPSEDIVTVGGVEIISEPVPLPGGQQVRIRWGGPNGGIAPISFKY